MLLSASHHDTLSVSHHDALSMSAIGLRAKEQAPISEVEDFDITQFLLKVMEKDSPFFQNNPNSKMPRFEANEVALAENLGQGEFGVIFSVKSIKDKDPTVTLPVVESNNTTIESPLKAPLVERSNRTELTQGETVVEEHDSDHDSVPDDHNGEEVAPDPTTANSPPSPNTIQIYLDLSLKGAAPPSGLDSKGLARLCDPNVSRHYMSMNALRDGMHRYCIKRLRKDLKGDVLIQATVDLATEANFLMALRHPNICRMRGTIGEPGKKGFAIVLDRLTITLRQKMVEWKKLDGRNSGNLLHKVKSKMLGDEKQREAKLEIRKHVYGEKLMAGYDIARALRHLAEHSVIYRDLKAENVGFDLRGDLRLFDFGLAKELKEKDMTSPGMYKLTGMTGSRRYMAPEVILSKDYGLSADVYAYSILFWEIMSNLNAYSYLTLEKHFEMVVQRKKRPDLKKMVSKKILPSDSDLHMLVKKCWSHKPADRPNIADVCDTLFSEIMAATRADDEYQSSKAAVDRSTHLAAGSLKSRLDDPLWC